MAKISEIENNEKEWTTSFDGHYVWGDYAEKKLEIIFYKLNEIISWINKQEKE